MPYRRADRVEKLLQQEVSKLLCTLKDPEFSGLVTVTGASLSSDLKNLQVFYSIIGSQEQKKKCAVALRRSQSYLHRELRKRLELKRIPALTFSYDPIPERADRIASLLEQIEKEKEEG